MAGRILDTGTLLFFPNDLCATSEIDGETPVEGKDKLLNDLYPVGITLIALSNHPMHADLLGIGAILDA